MRGKLFEVLNYKHKLLLVPNNLKIIIYVTVKSYLTVG